jgi:nucleotide-binding universal stress UspA family protein
MSFASGMKTIVVAADLSGQSEAALAYARKLAGGYGARIVLAHCVDPIEYAAVGSVPENLKGELSQQARAALDAMAGELQRQGVASHSEVRQGSVTQMMLDLALQFEAGLIVIGTRGMCGAGPLAVGVIAEQLVRLSPCPVLAVAADWNAGEFGPTPGGPILLAMEDNEAAPSAAGTAYSLAEIFHRTLQVVHARTPAEACAFLNPAATTLEEFGIRPSGRFPVRFSVKDGNPADVVAEAIAQYHPSLLVAGVKRASDTPGPHGTILAFLARSRVPVLCVPPEKRLAAARPDGCVTSASH